jgi:hypothetical protein
MTIFPTFLVYLFRQKSHLLGWQFRQGLESKRESEGLYYFSHILSSSEFRFKKALNKSLTQCFLLGDF